ncbi:MAG: hypothetical protein JNL57_11290 [Bacteroidetes bacterium]|nr:hypothetical protein [Bacteroidota bacterium]
MLPPLKHIGRIAGKHGYKGTVSVALNTAALAKEIKKGNFIFIEIDGKGVPFLIEAWNKEASLLHLKDIQTEWHADMITGLDICIEEKNPVDTAVQEDDDIIGWSVKDAEAGLLGTIEAIEDYPAGPMLMVTGKQELLIPLVDEWITKADSALKTLHLKLPEGFTEI